MNHYNIVINQPDSKKGNKKAKVEIQSAMQLKAQVAKFIESNQASLPVKNDVKLLKRNKIQRSHAVSNALVIKFDGVIATWMDNNDSTKTDG